MYLVLASFTASKFTEQESLILVLILGNNKEPSAAKSELFGAWDSKYSVTAHYHDEKAKYC